MTISDKTLPSLAEGCIFLHNKGFIVNCNLAYGIDWADDALMKHLERELMLLIEYYCDNLEVPPCSMLNMEISYVTQDMEHVKWCGAGTQMRVYSPDGQCYPCYYFEPLAIGEEMAERSLNIDFSNPSEFMDYSCKKCVLLPICPTCYGSNFASTGDISIKDKNMCRLTKVIALANSFFQYKKLSMYINKSLNIDEKRRKELTDAIIKVQNSFSNEFLLSK